MRENEKAVIETVIYTFLLCSAAFMFLITEHNYSTRILLGIILSAPSLLYVKKDFILKPEKGIRLLRLGIVAMGSGYFITGAVYRNSTFILIGFVIIIIIPVIQRYYQNKEDSIAQKMSIASAVFFLLFIILSFLFAPPITSRQYGGILINQNYLGVICVTAAPAGLLLCRSNRFWIGGCLLAADLAFIIFSTSRTAIIAVVLQILCSLILKISEVVQGYESKDILIKKISSLVCLSVAVFFVLFWSFTVLKDAEAKALPSLQMSTEYEESVSSDEDTPYLSLKEMYLKFCGRMGKGLRGEGDYSFTSGRIGIWKDYIENLSILGHEREERDQVVSGSRKYVSTNAHNAYIQVAYGAGIPAGIGFFLVISLAAIGCIRKLIASLKGRMLTDKEYYAILITIGYGIVSITSSNWMMFVHIPAMIFWTVAASLLTDPIDE